MLKSLIDLIKSGETSLPFNLVLGMLVVSTGTIIFANILKKINPQVKNNKLVWLLTLLSLPIFVLSGENILSRSALSLGLDITFFLNHLRNLILWICAGYLTVSAIRIFLWEGIFKSRTGSQVPQILVNFVSGIVYIFVIYFIMTFVFGLKVTGLVVSSGIIAGVIGLSMQNILSDLIAGIALAIEKPYRIGDWIEFADGTLGEVTDINWRTTRLLSWRNSIYVVPNGKAMEATVHNYSLPESSYRNIIYVTLSPSVSPEDARRILLEAALSCDVILKEPPPVVRLTDIEKQPYRYFISASYKDYGAWFYGRDRLMLSIWSSFRKFGIESSSDISEIHYAKKERGELKMPGIEDLLSEAELFKSLSKEEIAQIAEGSEIHLYRMGDYLIEKGKPGSSLYLITAGVVSVSSNNDFGEEVELARFGMGDTCGENSFLTGEPRSTNVIALSDSQAIEVKKEAFEDILKNKPELLDELGAIMAERRLHRVKKLKMVDRKSTSELLGSYAVEIIGKMKDFFSI